MAAPHEPAPQGRSSEGTWLLRVYDMISVEPEDVLADARGMGIQVRTIDELRSVRTSVLDGLADQYIRNAKMMTSLSGAGLGAGGLMLVGPDVSILAGSLLRLAQRLAIVYGFDYRRPAESVHVWTALAHALGVDKVFDGAGQIAVRNLPKLLAQGAGKSKVFKSLVKIIAARLGWLVTERSIARVLPFVGAGVAAVTNFQLVRDLGGKMRLYFRERHIAAKVDRGPAAPPPTAEDTRESRAPASPRKRRAAPGAPAKPKKKTKKSTPSKPLANKKKKRA